MGPLPSVIHARGVADSEGPVPCTPVCDSDRPGPRPGHNWIPGRPTRALPGLHARLYTHAYTRTLQRTGPWTPRPKDTLTRSLPGTH